MRIELVAPEPAWPVTYEQFRQRLTGMPGARLRRIEHVGSTAVPVLAAKPVIDIVVTVDDPADEAAYLPGVESIGFVLRRREPEWYEHRVFRHDDQPANLHVFADDCVEVERMLRFRDRLRASPADRRRYESVKRSLSGREWPSVQAYADAKSDVVEEILARAGQSDT